MFIYDEKFLDPTELILLPNLTTCVLDMKMKDCSLLSTLPPKRMNGILKIVADNYSNNEKIIDNDARILFEADYIRYMIDKTYKRRMSLHDLNSYLLSPDWTFSAVQLQSAMIYQGDIPKYFPAIVPFTYTTPITRKKSKKVHSGKNSYDRLIFFSDFNKYYSVPSLHTGIENPIKPNKKYTKSQIQAILREQLISLIRAFSTFMPDIEFTLYIDCSYISVVEGNSKKEAKTTILSKVINQEKFNNTKTLKECNNFIRNNAIDTNRTLRCMMSPIIINDGNILNEGTKTKIYVFI